MTVDGKAELVTGGSAGIVVTTFAEAVTRLDFDSVQLDISRALKSATDDPEDAVTSACSLVEAVSGDAHGREKGHRRIDPRIARLAINAASSLALFLIEPWELKQHRTLLLKGA